MLVGSEHRTFYELLGVRWDASEVEIEAAWKRLMFAVHPDRAGRSPSEQARATLAAAALMRVRGTLLDPRRRMEYDRDLATVRDLEPSIAPFAHEQTEGVHGPLRVVMNRRHWGLREVVVLTLAGFALIQPIVVSGGLVSLAAVAILVGFLFRGTEPRSRSARWG